MRQSWVLTMVVALLATGAYTVLASDHCSQSCGTSAKGSACSSSKKDACGSSSQVSAAACESRENKIAGHFDPTMSSVCRFACATQLHYQRDDVQAQPGAVAGKLTQCPVSGVVFAVDRTRPRVRIGGEQYVTCCDKCAQKLKRDPRHYLKA